MSLKDRFQNLWHTPEDEYEEDEYGADSDFGEEVSEPEYAPRKSSLFSGGSSRSPEFSSSERENVHTNHNVVNISNKTKVKMALFKPVSFGEETRVIADELIQKHTVIVNLENTEKEVSRRIIDFLSGVAYAYSGSIKRIASGTFIIIPYNVDLMGDGYLDDIENGNYF
jgi:cell division inhibitor SepF